jgi:hypothetical protein
MGKPKLKKVDWYGFHHHKVSTRFEGQLSFCAEFCVNGEYKPVAVYKAKKPNKAKGHKKYLLLQLTADDVALVRGMSAKQMIKWRYQEAIHCLNCNTILYSINRHHYHGCGCEKEVTIDGGKDYTKIGYKEDSKYKIVTLDLLTGKIKK